MRKTMRKSALLSSVAMLIVSAIVLTSATYAWFSTSKKVTVEQLDISVNAATGLLVSVDKGASWDNKINFAGTNVAAVKSAWGAGVPAKFSPVSSSNGSAWVKGEFDKDAANGGALTLTDAVAGKDGQFVAVPFWVTGPAKEGGTKVNITVDFTDTNDKAKSCLKFALVPANEAGDDVKDTTTSFAKAVTADGSIGGYYGVSAKTGLAEGKADKTAYLATAGGKDITEIAAAEQITLSATVSDTAPERYIAFLWLEGNDEDCVLEDFLKDNTRAIKFKMTLTIAE